MEIWELKNVMTKIFQNLGRYKPTDSIAEQTTNRINQKKSMPWYIIIKFLKIKNRKKILKAPSEKGEKTIWMKAHFSSETMEARIKWHIFQLLKH